MAGSADAAAAKAERADGASGAPDADGDDAVRLEIGLEHTRWRHFGWALFGMVGGAILIVVMGTVAQWLGGILVALGAWAAVSFVRTLVFEAGAIVVEDKKVLLPRGVCRGKPREVARDTVAHAYLLRRAVPWTRAAPVLVIEAAGQAHLFPRDWFASEADQRRVIHALARRD